MARYYRPEITDQCTPRQRKLLDRWQWLGCRGKTVYNSGHFYVLLRVYKTTGYYYGVFAGNLTWDKIRLEVRNGNRAKLRRDRKKALLEVGAGI